MLGLHLRFYRTHELLRQEQTAVRPASRETRQEAPAVTQVPEDRVAGVERVKSGWVVDLF